jgi:hypothetical protein
MPFEAYRLYKEYEKDKYKTSTQKKAEGVLSEVKDEALASEEHTIDVQDITDALEKLLANGADKDYVAWGLAGVGTPEAMAMRRELIANGVDKGYVARGLAGVGTPEAMVMRRELIANGVNKDYVAWGLAGVGTPEAMVMRRELIANGVNKGCVARGLAGVATPEATEFREQHFGDNPTLWARSYTTGWSVTDGVVCRYGYEE